LHLGFLNIDLFVLKRDLKRKPPFSIPAATVSSGLSLFADAVRSGRKSMYADNIMRTKPAEDSNRTASSPILFTQKRFLLGLTDLQFHDSIS